MRKLLGNWAALLPLVVGLAQPAAGAAVAKNPNTDWLKSARLGAFMHFLPHDSVTLGQVKSFHVEALAWELEAIGAKYLILTLGQNSGYFNSPNASYDRITGYSAGDRCSARDLPLDLYPALQAKGIRLMLYLPCQTPNQDARAQRAFGLPEGKQDQPIDEAFARRWAEVIKEWSVRYGDKVAGWWFDGAYAQVRFNDAIGEIYAQAAKAGNRKAIVTFNPGVRVVRHSPAEDYTAGELKEPFDVVPASRWLDGSQWHALTFLGSAWGQRNTRFPAERWSRWVAEVVRHGGVVTLDVGPNWNPQLGPIGSLSAMQATQFKAISAALSKR